MCGISGIVKPGIDPSGSAIKLMVDCLQHRGPDAQRHVMFEDCHLGHDRLSIIDLSTGDQPMSYGNERFWITYNGEIYNYRELRKELIAEGCSFRTASDTEVLLAAYARWGTVCLERLRGMFAFAIWDRKDKRLFAARDIFGEKPFYYAQTEDGAFIFASEMKAILASGLISPVLNLDSVDAYLALGYVPPYRTVYKNIQVLPPGHFLFYQNSNTETTKYWAPRFPNRCISPEEAKEQLLSLLRQATNRQTVSDVPIGAFLSGGLDSSSVVTMLERSAARPTKTFSVGFGSYINELPYARLVAKRYGTEHHEIDMGDIPVADIFEKLGSVYDEPIADLSNIPTFLICEYARRFVKVVLSGDGGDEIFGGYSRYPKILISEGMKSNRLQWGLLRILSRLTGEHFEKLSIYSVAAGLAIRWKDIWMRGAMFNLHWSKQERIALWGKRHVNVSAFNPNGNHYPGQEITGLHRVFYYDLTSALPGDILVKVDRAAMAHGLETRSPLLDRDLVEFMLSLPVNFKVDRYETKVLLRKAVSQYWPQELSQRVKQGFSIPAQRWLARQDMQALAKRMLKPKSPLNYLLPGLKNLLPLKRDYKTWIILNLGVWLENQGVNV